MSNDECDFSSGLNKKVITTDTEIEAGVERDELISILVDGACDGGLEVDVLPRRTRNSQESEPWECNLKGGPWIFDDWPDVPMPTRYLRIEYDLDVPITLLIDAIRSSDVPLFYDSGWLAWDRREQRLKDSPISVEQLWNDALLKRSSASLREDERQLTVELHRAIFSSDHGSKPLLVKREFVEDVVRRRKVIFGTPHRITSEMIGSYMLAFFDSVGEVEVFPLTLAAKLGLPIFSRTSAYLWQEGDLKPLFNDASLVAGAYLLATNCSPSCFHWFRAKERGTIFQPALERIAAPSNQEPEPRTRPGFSLNSVWTNYGLAAPLTATRMREWAADLGTVYITSGGHPLATELVTTPELYEKAVHTLDRFSYRIEFKNFDEKVKVSRVKKG